MALGNAPRGEPHGRASGDPPPRCHRALIKIPNGKLADARIESFGERDRIRFFMVLQLDRATSAAQLRVVLGGTEALLRASPRVSPDGATVRLVAFGPQRMDVNVNALVATTDYGEFELLRQELLLGILDIVERAGTGLATPVQVLRVEPGEGDASVGLVRDGTTGRPRQG